MRDRARYDLAACDHWQESVPFGAARLGIIPDWNAVTLLNPAAATIWDLLIETRDTGAAAAGYGVAWPDRAAAAAADVAACLEAWHAQGLLRAPPRSPEQSRLAARGDRPVPEPAQCPYDRTLSVAGVPVRLGVADAALARIVADLTVDFPEADAPDAPRLCSTGPDGGWFLTLDGAPLRLADGFVAARGQIVAELVRLAAGGAGWLATIHGAVLEGSAGAVFLAGATGAGKSTLSAGLVARGWRLLAEDLAAFDADLAVTPMPFALSIKDGAVDVLAGAFPDLSKARVHQLGPRRVRYQGLPATARGTRPARPRLIVDVRYTAGMAPDEAACDRLSPVEALGLFMNEESYIEFADARAPAFLAFVETTPACTIRYGSIAAAERAIRACLDQPRDSAPG